MNFYHLIYVDIEKISLCNKGYIRAILMNLSKALKTNGRKILVSKLYDYRF